MPIIDETLPPVPWLERLLGYADAPQLIQCRVCMKFKKSDAKNFRNARTFDQFRTTCRPCEYKTAKGRTTAMRQRMIEQDPTLPESFKAALFNALPDVVRASKKARGDVKRDAYMKRRWDMVRMIVSKRRLLLDARIRASAFYNGSLYHCMKEHPRTQEYVRRVLALYSMVISRLRRVDKWLDTVGEHFPPPHWDSVLQAQMHARKENWRATLAMRLMDIDPWEFTTADERAELRMYDPDGGNAGEGERTEWQQAVLTRGTIRFHVYPSMLPADATRADVPAWLCEFNGYPPPPKPAVVHEPDWVPKKRGPQKKDSSLVFQSEVKPIEHDEREWAKRMGLDEQG